MTKQELLDILRSLNNNIDPELNHGAADAALVDFINDPDIREAYDNIIKWYA